MLFHVLHLFQIPASHLIPLRPTLTTKLKRKFKKKLFDAPKKANLKKRIKLLQQTVRSQNTKINTLEVFIKKLENSSLTYAGVISQYA